MTQDDLRQIEERLVSRILQELSRLVEHPLPTVLTKKAAMKELSISKSKMAGLIKAGALQTCTVGRVEMIPRSEVLRLSRPRAPNSGASRSAKRGKAAPPDGRTEAQKIRAALRKR